jgi:Spondin_N/Secretion system C-terminal sorting domain
MKKITKSITLGVVCLLTATSFAQSTATYDFTFTSVWNSNHHGTLPGSAHWSDLVGATHNSDVTFLEMGGMATPGIELVAEAGSNGVFNAEVNSAIGSGYADRWLQRSVDPFAAIASATLSDIVVSEDFPLLTLVSMIAPSPDWIIAVNSLNLWDSNSNTWKESFTVDLYPYDAGTEDGFGYSGNNLPTNPRGFISNVAGANGYPFGPEKIGTLTVTFKSTTLSINDLDAINTSIKVFPNPSEDGTVTISNTNSIDNIVIFDILGKEVLRFNNKGIEEETYDISNLTSGTYIIRLIDANGSIDHEKLLVK